MNHETGYSDFIKENILCCYMEMQRFIGTLRAWEKDDISDEECLNRMLYEIKKRRVGIPTELYLKIKKFIEEELRPVVYEYNRIFIPITYEKDKLGSFARDGVFEMYDEDALDRFRLSYFKRLGELADEIEAFGMNEIYPILMR